jgi:triosephosphate isomerase
MRKKLLLGNWKMNKTPEEAKAFALAASEMVDFAVSHGIDVGVAPTFVCLDTVKRTSIRNASSRPKTATSTIMAPSLAKSRSRC